jgi:hypothetical protein
MQEERSSKTFGRILLGVCGGIGLGKLKLKKTIIY